MRETEKERDKEREREIEREEDRQIDRVRTYMCLEVFPWLTIVFLDKYGTVVTNENFASLQNNMNLPCELPINQDNKKITFVLRLLNSAWHCRATHCVAKDRKNVHNVPAIQHADGTILI